MDVSDKSSWTTANHPIREYSLSFSGFCSCYHTTSPLSCTCFYARACIHRHGTAHFPALQGIFPPISDPCSIAFSLQSLDTIGTIHSLQVYWHTVTLERKTSWFGS